MKISVPYNFDFNLLNLITLSYSGSIDELYFPAGLDFVGSSRPQRIPGDYAGQIGEIITFLHKHRIKANMLVNGQCEGISFMEKGNLRKLMDHIKFYRQQYGLDAITVIDLVHLPEIRRYIPDIQIHSSINLQVRNVDKASYLKDMGVDVITIDKEINKRPDIIKEIKEQTGTRLKMLVNEPCLPDCPFRIQHANLASHISRTDLENTEAVSDAIFFARCAEIYQQKPWLFFISGFIRPEDIKYFEGLVDSIKIVDRMGSTKRILSIIEAYSKRRFDGDLLDLVFVSRSALRGKGLSFPNRFIPEDFFPRLLEIKNERERQDYCRKICDSLNNLDVSKKMHK